jgi:hypothetical protein
METRFQRRREELEPVGWPLRKEVEGGLQGGALPGCHSTAGPGLSPAQGSVGPLQDAKLSTTKERYQGRLESHFSLNLYFMGKMKSGLPAASDASSEN